MYTIQHDWERRTGRQGSNLQSNSRTTICPSRLLFKLPFSEILFYLNWEAEGNLQTTASRLSRIASEQKNRWCVQSLMRPVYLGCAFALFNKLWLLAKKIVNERKNEM